MKSQIITIIFLFCFALTGSSLKGQESWLQFRGPGSCGIAPASSATPIIPDPQKNLAWKTKLAPGLSSPVVVNDMVFITGFDEADKALVTYCVSMTKGNVLWERRVHPDTLETCHQVGSPASSTPVTDGKAVYVFFGSYGVLCYDMTGNLLWEHRLPLLHTTYGTASSPVLGNNLVIISRHDLKDPSVLALDKRTGKKVWEHHVDFPAGVPLERSNSSSTPVIRGDQVIIHSHFQLLSLRLSDGKINWSHKLVSLGVSTPVIINDILYVNGYLNFGESGLYDPIPTFSEMTSKYDTNRDNLISFIEIPENWALQRRPELKNLDISQFDTLAPMRSVAVWFDSDKDEKLSLEEWMKMVELQQSYRLDHGTIALKLNTEDKTRRPELLWKVADKIPEVPSVLVVDGRVYMICDGGILTCINATTGRIIYRDRLKGTSLYLSSPVYASDHIYAVSYNGFVTVITPADKLIIDGTYRVGTRIGSSPAVAGNTLLVRDENWLMAFKSL